MIGLYSSLPLLWPEAGDISGYLRQEGPAHWALEVLSGHGRLVPLDTLASANGTLPLPRHATLVLAQPRPLSPDENVALDRWVRGGGRVLLFADPMLTSHSRFALGDARRPQDVVLLSPILARWGLELQFDDAQPAGRRERALAKGRIAVDLPGRFATMESGEDCVTEADGLLADCRVGDGRVLAVADAALFDTDSHGAEHDDEPSGAAILDLLLDRLGG